ncbi:uncharacterized protein LOC117168418 [Belonocnema kinseyi]|uniref:uncharacterized protein LOC117168418 n=1 Tax=Belonocnema kinseyi TaxID=2817044 RepID=UPI00143CDD59|nr:uncharacterized protein LOC117168418 [Belonocnema kinseyi]
MDPFNSHVNNMLLSMAKGLDITDRESLPFQKEEGSFKRYYPNHCQICQCIDNEKSPLKRCSRCQLVSYCGKEHQAQDFKQHKDLCKALSKLGGPRLFVDLKKTQFSEDAPIETKIMLMAKRSFLKMDILSQITTQLNRKPYFYELQIVNFPRVCSVCFESNPTKLQSCPNCPQSSFCVEHRDDPSHSKICSCFNLAREIEFDEVGKMCFKEEKTTLETFKFPCQKNKILPKSMKDFLKDDSCLQVKRTKIVKQLLSERLWQVYVSELISCPLTLLYAKEKLQLQVESNFVIHVIGSTRHEIQGVFWELILHWLPAVTRLDIVFIGPELKYFPTLEKERTQQTCKDCKGRKLNFHTFDGFYENYDDRENYFRPNIVAAFNAGLAAYPTWIPALNKIASIHCPFIVTSYSELQARQDDNWFKNLVSGAEYLSLELNPFANFKYERSPEDEKVFVQNEYLTIYDSF